MIFPKWIQTNDTIGVTATSDGNGKDVDFLRLNSAIHNLEAIGLHVKETDNVRHSKEGRSSSGKERWGQLKELVEAPEVTAIVTAKGGDYLMEMLPYIDFDYIKRNPKWIQGFSDTTGLTMSITTLCDIATIYCNNFNDYGMIPWDASVDINIRILKGEKLVQKGYKHYQKGFPERVTGLEPYQLEYENRCHAINGEKKIEMRGRVLGGCLDVLLNLVGTPYEKVKEYVARYHADGILWYLESFDLGCETFARGLWQLKEAGWFQNATGFVFGRPAFYAEDGVPYDEVIREQLGSFHLPIITEADIGHMSPQFTMINGALAQMIFENGTLMIQYDFR